jgi:NADPH:quinone reductase-like Zn-dependent oxidoreductase
MKAAVLREVGGIPRYEEFPDPVAGEDEVIVEVKAVAVENVDKMVAAGTHYAGGQFVTGSPVKSICLNRYYRCRTSSTMNGWPR